MDFKSNTHLQVQNLTELSQLKRLQVENCALDLLEGSATRKLHML